MASTSFENLPLLASKSIGKKYPINVPFSPQTSIYEEYITPRPSLQSNELLSDSEGTLTGSTLTEDSDEEDFVSVSSNRHVRFELRRASIETYVVVDDDEAEFFTVIPLNNTKADDKAPKTLLTKPRRKRDRIRSIFNKKTRHTSTDSSDSNGHDWDEMLAKTLVSMHRDIHEIITGLDELTDPIPASSTPEPIEPILTTPRLSFLERQRTKLEMMRMAQMLSPPNLLTYDMKVTPYSYTDIVEPVNFNILRTMKNVPSENLLVQHKPFRHKKFRYRTQRGLLKIRRDFHKLRDDVYGKSTIRSYKELPSVDVQNYRHRLEKTLLDVRQQIAEYDRIHASKSHSRQSISQIISKMKVLDPVIEAQMEDYRLKLRPMEFIDRRNKNGLISAPFIPKRTRSYANNIKKPKVNELVDSRFDPTTFVDLGDEAEKFFGSGIPFWQRPLTARLSFAVETIRQRSPSFDLPEHTGVWARFITDFKSKQKILRRLKHQSSDSKENGDEFLDCSTPPLQQRKSQLLTLPEHNQTSTSFHEDNINHF